MLKRSTITVLAIALFSITNFSARAQEDANVEPHGVSLGFNFGMSDLWGDVGTKSMIDHYTNNKYTDLLHYMGGLMFRYSLHPALAARLSVNYGTLFATDEWNLQQAKKASSLQDDYVQRYARYQDIKDNVWETSLTFEFTPLRLGNPLGKAAQHRGQFYLLAGIGYFHFQPYSHYTDPETKVTSWVKIYDLHLEGDGFSNMPDAPAKYSLWQLEIPLGVGYKKDIGEHLNVGIQWQWRMTMFDYLDGVSNKYIDPKYFAMNLPPDKAYMAKAMYDRTWVPGVVRGGAPVGSMRGNPSNNDSYSTISVVVYWKFGTRTTNWWQ
jgi:hypothetical protein